MVEAPALFVSHGSPTFALQPGLLGPKLGALGRSLPDLKAVAVVSAHWQSAGVQVMRTAAPETIHDFGGFPEQLYRLRYPAPGAVQAALEAARLLKDAGLDQSFEDRRGLDHGAWVPLLHLLPKANVAVFQVSLPFHFGPAQALALGQALAPLRRQGVLVVGSGSLTHNLGEVRRDPPDAHYAAEFTAWIRTHVQQRDRAALLDYRRRAPHAQRAHPTEEHLLPLFVAVGASGLKDTVQVLDGGMTYAVLSMESYVFAGN